MVYERVQKNSSSWSPAFHQDKTESRFRPRPFSIQPEADTEASQEEEIPAYSRADRDAISAKLLQSMGGDISFGARKYDQSPSEKKQLQGYELTHVAQQTGGIQRQLTGEPQSSADEFGEPSLSNDLPPPEQRRMIRMGSQGKEVTYAQERLNAHGATPPLVIDGIFGRLTRKATLEYQNTHGLVDDAVIGPRTWASLDGPTVVGGKSGQGKSGGSTPGSGSTLKYDTTAHSISPPPQGTTLASIKAALQTKQDKKPQPDLGKTLNVKGVNAGTDEEIFVWNVLLQLGTFKRWGSEVDVVTEIGRPAKPGNKAPVGQITLRIDAQGNATAELLKRSTVASPATFTTMDQAKKALQTDFKIGQIKDDTASWTPDDLNKVHAAFSRMPTSERSALSGVDLIRQHTIIEGGEQLSGLFSHQSQVAQGAASASRSQSISLADSAFAGDNISFIGDQSNAAVASFETILHEAGHAVETKALRDAQFATMEATAKLNGTIQTLNTAVTAFNAEQASAFKTAKGYKQTQIKECQSFLKSINQATKAIDTLGKSQKASQHQQEDASASTAIKARDTEKTKLSGKSATHPALTDFANTLKRQDDWFAAAQARAKAHTDLDTAQKQEKAVSGSPNQSKRLKNFVDFVNKNNIPPLTEYAKVNWPQKPGEFFAEAYSLWLNDRTYLTANAKPLVDWFDSGEHLK